MASYISVSLRRRIEQYDQGQCRYCYTQAVNSGIPLSFEHILPRSKGGQNTFENVCLACRSCNEFKASTTEGIDALTGEKAALFNPRLQRWLDHFVWSEDGTRIEGITPVGRVTSKQLRMNHAAIVAARRRWVSSGWHPPLDLM